LADIIDFIQRKKESANADALEIAHANPDFHSLNDENKMVIIKLIRRILDSVGTYQLPNLEGMGLTEEQTKLIYTQCTGAYQNMLNGLGWILGGFVTLSIQSIMQNEIDGSH